MDCREFRDRHALYIDERCSALEESEMRRHLQQCPTCSRQDTVVRRGLMLIRSLPSIEPSPDFRARLEARLRATSPLMTPARPRMPWSQFAALAAGVAFVTWIATDLLRRADAGVVTLAPVIASAPAPDPAPVATSAFVAAVPTGMSVWPAIMVASQAPMHFVAAELASER